MILLAGIRRASERSLFSFYKKVQSVDSDDTSDSFLCSCVVV